MSVQFQESPGHKYAREHRAGNYLYRLIYFVVGTSHERVVPFVAATAPTNDVKKSSNEVPTNNSVARGGKWCYSPPPIGLKSMQNSVVLAVLRLISALKREIAPHRKIAPPKIVRWEVDHLILDGKTLWISVKTFFFWRSLVFGRKNALNLPQSNWKHIKIRVLNQTSKKAPPLRIPGYATAHKQDSSPATSLSKATQPTPSRMHSRAGKA